MRFAQFAHLVVAWGAFWWGTVLLAPEVYWNTAGRKERPIGVLNGDNMVLARWIVGAIMYAMWWSTLFG